MYVLKKVQYQHFVISTSLPWNKESRPLLCAIVELEKIMSAWPAAIHLVGPGRDIWDYSKSLWKVSKTIRIGTMPKSCTCTTISENAKTY